MTLVIRISDQAGVDVMEIWSAIAEDNPLAADRMVDALISAYTLLSSMPGAGRARSELGQWITAQSLTLDQVASCISPPADRA
jgi:plasmid stabilization system protein ParE